ncbi:MAG: aminotransferase class I/II-fold pyridoxal phosphate-dependent enzyme [Alcanivoracaceae bacterium]|nr:aminotransferase class I/II-fold pyridoxal phosphate-dependent enzyme [Alcanivoracaceae bacterium]
MNQSEVMNFLNEVAMQFPHAISLASGRPNSRFFDKNKWQKYQDIFTLFYAQELEIDTIYAEKLLCQYGPSAGIINRILEKHLAIDESIHTNAENIIVTNGCQEALALLCLKLLKNNNDCMLTLDPSYIGFSGLINAIGKKVLAIEIDKVSHINDNNKRQFTWEYISTKVDELKTNGLSPKAIYVNPDFNNPLSYRLNKNERESLLNVCKQLELILIEDNPYSRFNYSGVNELSLKALYY